MAITQTQIIQSCISMFDAAPGAINLATLEAWVEANPTATEADFSIALGEIAEFDDQFDGMTDAQAATEMMSHFDLVAGTTAGDNALAWIEANQGTQTNAQILAAANTYLLDATNRDAMFDDAATVLSNKTTVAEYYSVTKAISGDTLMLMLLLLLLLVLRRLLMLLFKLQALMGRLLS